MRRDDQDAREPRGVGVAQRRVEELRVGRVVRGKREEPVRGGDGRARRRDDRDGLGLGRESRGEFARVDEFARRLGRVVRGARPRARGLHRDMRRLDALAEHFRELRERDGARPQHRRPRAREVDDRRFEADLAGPAVEDHEVVRIGELARDMRGARRRDAAAPVRARRRDGLAERRDQRLRDGMRGRAYGDRRPSADRERADLGTAGQDDRERPRPERLGEPLRADVPAEDAALRHRDIGDMRDERVVAWPRLQPVDLADRGLARRIASEPVHRLRRKRNGQPAPQALGARRDVLGGRIEDDRHAGTLPRGGGIRRSDAARARGRFTGAGVAHRGRAGARARGARAPPARESSTGCCR